MTFVSVIYRVCSVYVGYCLFFFFKQKTAYEMRISDWSSDVCSSDLRSNVRPEPAPITWMIEAHSAFLSMSASDAFCTLRILPRIGSNAWNSLERASFAVDRKSVV